MFSNTSSQQYRIMYNPVNSGINSSTELNNIDEDTLKTIEMNYTSVVANKIYENIPRDYTQYLHLFGIVRNMQSKVNNNVLKLFLKIIEEALVSAINTYTIYGERLLLQIDKTNLLTRIDDILSNKNNTIIQPMTTTGSMSITRQFRFNNLYNYYILIYGLPVYGVGFDPIKIAFLKETLIANGINPFC